MTLVAPYICSVCNFDKWTYFSTAGSLRCDRFRGVQEQRNTKERYFARAKLGREQNNEEGVGEGKSPDSVRTGFYSQKACRSHLGRHYKALFTRLLLSFDSFLRWERLVKYGRKIRPE